MASATSDIAHHEFLFTETGCPDTMLIDALRQALPRTGSIVTWKKSFEMTINRRLAERNAGAAEFFADVNARIVDLIDVFSGESFIHPDFKGRTSIKVVLPVLAPELSYKSIEIQEGGSASDAWNRIVTELRDDANIARVRSALLTYCGLDTQAMWEIWRVLRARVS